MKRQHPLRLGQLFRTLEKPDDADRFLERLDNFYLAFLGIPMGLAFTQLAEVWLSPTCDHSIVRLGDWLIPVAVVGMLFMEFSVALVLFGFTMVYWRQYFLEKPIIHLVSLIALVFFVLSVIVIAFAAKTSAIGACNGAQALGLAFRNGVFRTALFTCLLALQVMLFMVFPDIRGASLTTSDAGGIFLRRSWWAMRVLIPLQHAVIFVIALYCFIL